MGNTFIVVQIEAEIGRLADADRDPLHHRIGIVRQLQQQRFLGGDLSNRASLVFLATPVGGRALAPGLGLGVQSARSAKLRTAKKEVRQYGIALSTRPFSLPRAIATGRGSKR